MAPRTAFRTAPVARRGRPPSKAPSGAPSPLHVRARLLEAAAELFATHGIAASSTTHIAARAGVTGAMIHYYFDSRDKLLDAFVEERMKPLVDFVWADTEVDASDPIGRITELARRIFRCADENAWLPPLWIREIASTGGALRERMLKLEPKERLASFAHAIEAGKRQGSINRGIEPELVFLSVVGLTMFPIATAGLWQRVVAHPRRARAKLRRHVETVLLHAFGQQPPEGAARLAG